jgi:hypothetical protein
LVNLINLGYNLSKRNSIYCIVVRVVLLTTESPGREFEAASMHLREEGLPRIIPFPEPLMWEPQSLGLPSIYCMQFGIICFKGITSNEIVLQRL